MTGDRIECGSPTFSVELASAAALSTSGRVMTRVLIVEDDDAIRDALEGLLADASYQVHTARNGCAALALLEHAGVDVLVVDLFMPVMSGEDLIGALRRRGVSIPTLITSASADLRRRAHAIGAGDYLLKPYRIDDLIAKIGELAAAPRSAALAPLSTGNDPA